MADLCLLCATPVHGGMTLCYSCDPDWDNARLGKYTILPRKDLTELDKEGLVAYLHNIGVISWTGWDREMLLDQAVIHSKDKQDAGAFLLRQLQPARSFTMATKKKTGTKKAAGPTENKAAAPAEKKGGRPRKDYSLLKVRSTGVEIRAGTVADAIAGAAGKAKAGKKVDEIVDDLQLTFTAKRSKEFDENPRKYIVGYVAAMIKNGQLEEV